jgi:hypothetical protein
MFLLLWQIFVTLRFFRTPTPKKDIPWEACNRSHGQISPMEYFGSVRVQTLC